MMDGTDVWPAVVLNVLNFRCLLAVIKYLFIHHYVLRSTIPSYQFWIRPSMSDLGTPCTFMNIILILK